MMKNEIEFFNKEKHIGTQKPFFAKKAIIKSDFQIHFHDYFELEIVVDGSGIMTLNGNDVEFSVGTVFFITPKDFHSYKNCNNVVIYNISFKENVVFGSKIENKILKKLQSVITVDDELLPSLVTICRLMMELDGTKLEGETYLLRSIFALLPPFYEVKRLRSYTHNATAFIENHFKEKLSAQDVAKHCNINVDYLNKLFKKEIGLTVTDYIRKIRIEYADVLIKNTNLSVSEVAFSSGFQSIQTFNRIYKQQYGIPPTAGKK